MNGLTQKELDIICKLIAAEGLACKKAVVYSHTLTDDGLADCMARTAEGHYDRFGALLKLIGE